MHTLVGKLSEEVSLLKLTVQTNSVCEGQETFVECNREKRRNGQQIL